VAPRDTPDLIIARLHEEMNAGLTDPTFSQRLLIIGVAPRPMRTAEFGQFVADEIDKWAKVIKFAEIKPVG
jgi:tripartite-type tricarboxylate transporter receptor subunit TctC